MSALTWRTAPLSGARPVVEVIVCEELDREAAARLTALLDDLLALHPDRLIIDLRKCPFVGAVAVDVLLKAHRRIWLAGGLLTLRSPSPRVRRLLRLARVDHVLDTTPETLDTTPETTDDERTDSAFDDW